MGEPDPLAVTVSSVDTVLGALWSETRDVWTRRCRSQVVTRFSAPTLSTVIRHAARTRTYTTGDATLPAGTMTSRLREVWHRAAGL